MHDFVSVKDRLPDAGQEVEAMRDYGAVVLNGGHHACGCRFGIERTRFERGPMFGFVCDMMSTGHVTHWRPAGSMEVCTIGYPALDAMFEDLPPNVQGQGRCAALSRSVPCTAGLGHMSYSH